MINGSCLCGAVRWQVDAVVDNMTHCHCSMCRKLHAAPFGTYVSAEPEHFHWRSGIETIVRYESSPGFVRAFCGACGSVLPESGGKGRIALPAGCLDDDPGVRPTAHIFAPSKAPWHILGGDLPRYENYPNPDDGPNIARPAAVGSTDGVLHGSCLCAEVAYEVTTPIEAVHCCHCSRCRKARAAAHATNGLTAINGVAFTRGERQIQTFELPSAHYFAQAFCTRCGSGMPHLDRKRELAIVAFGSLDDDPDRVADDHIFTSSMAPWYTIEDNLPRFDTVPG